MTAVIIEQLFIQEHWTVNIVLCGKQVCLEPGYHYDSTRFLDLEQWAAYSWFENTWISYDTEVTILAKVSHILQLHPDITLHPLTYLLLQPITHLLVCPTPSRVEPYSNHLVHLTYASASLHIQNYSVQLLLIIVLYTTYIACIAHIHKLRLLLLQLWIKIGCICLLI